MSLVNSSWHKEFDGMVVRMYRQRLDCMRILHPFVGEVVTLPGNQLIPVPVSEQPNGTVIKLLEIPEMENKDCSPSAKKTMNDHNSTLDEKGRGMSAPLDKRLHRLKNLHYQHALYQRVSCRGSMTSRPH